MTRDDLLTFDGITQPITEWALDYGIPADVIIKRLKEGQSVEAAITTMIPFDAEPEPQPRKSGSRAILHTYNGESLTAREWSSRTGIPVSTIHQRIKRGLPLADVLNPDLCNRNKPYTHNGETHTLSEWAALSGVKYETLRHRICDQGLSLGEAISKRKHARPSAADALHTHNGETKTLREWAEHVGITLPTLRERMNKFGLSLGEALDMPKNAKRLSRARRPTKSEQRTSITITVAGVKIEIETKGPGVVFNFGASAGTGAGGTEQEIPEITFKAEDE